MTWRAKVEDNFAANGVSILLGVRHEDRYLVVKPMTVELEVVDPATSYPAALSLDVDLARELYRALTAYFGDIADNRQYRTLRDDYLHERERVDKFIDKLLRVAD